MNKIAHILSWVISPIMVPTYAIFICLWCTALSLLPVSVRWNVVSMTWLITCLLPALAIVVLYWMKVVSGPGLNLRSDRFIPYSIVIACYLGEWWYLSNIHAPAWMRLFILAAAGAALTDVLVNIRWKISAHATAMGGLVALMFRIAISGHNTVTIWPYVLMSIILLGALCTARLILQRHTFGQVALGSLTGFLWVFLLTLIH